MSSIELLENFTLDDLPFLDTVVMGALELFSQQALPHVDVSMYQNPLVVGSGNAEAAGRIIFENSQAVFASESTVEAKLRNIPQIDGVVVLSASGAKHAPRIVDTAHQYQKPVTLLTNTANAPAQMQLNNAADRVYVFPKNREPYTYNTSTYLGMILGATHEDPAAIARHIEQTIAPIIWPDFSSYDKYYLIVPPQFSGIIRMLQVKFIELFGRSLARDVETSEYVVHATTVVPNRELFISFGDENTQWGNPADRLYIPLPEQAGYGTMMAVGYFVIAQIQKAYPSLFKDNIGAYTAEVSAIFGSTITPIVEK